MPEAKKDRRVQRTRQLLESAMVSLIKEKGFEALTVQDIIDRANVGRSTFYSHYKSKDDLMKGSVEMLRSSLRRLQLQARSGTMSRERYLFAFSREFFVHAEQHRDVFAVMMGERSGTMFQQHLHRMLGTLVRDDLRSIRGRRSRDAVQVEAVTQFVVGGLIGLATSWVNETRQLSADEIDTLFRQMAIPAAEAMLR